MWNWRSVTESDTLVEYLLMFSRALHQTTFRSIACRFASRIEYQLPSASTLNPQILRSTRVLHLDLSSPRLPTERSSDINESSFASHQTLFDGWRLQSRFLVFQTEMTRRGPSRSIMDATAVQNEVSWHLPCLLLPVFPYEVIETVCFQSACSPGRLRHLCRCWSRRSCHSSQTSRMPLCERHFVFSSLQ